MSQKPASTVRFFDRNDFYSLHGEDAHLAAKIIFKSTASVKKMAPDGEHPVDYISLSKGNFEILLRELLLVKNYRVEVYTKKGQSNDWSIEFKGSPGNLIQFENLLFNNTEMMVGSSVIAINLKQVGQQKVCIYHFVYCHSVYSWSFVNFRTLESHALNKMNDYSPWLNLKTMIFSLNWKRLSFCLDQKKRFYHRVMVNLRIWLNY